MMPSPEAHDEMPSTQSEPFEASGVNKRLDVIVIGGSLAGLMNGIVLKRLGHNVTILERSPVALLHDQGAGIVAGNETLAWVQKYTGLQADDISVLSSERLYLDRGGNVIDREAKQQRMTSWGVLYKLGRQGFDGHDNDPVRAAVNDENYARYEYGRTVEGVQDLSDKVEVQFKQRDSEQNEASLHRQQADIIVVADGPSTSLRQMLLGDGTAQRKYAGYVAFRGTVLESDLSPAASEVFVQRFTFFHGTLPNTQALAYTIPGQDGTLEKGKRLVNWVWYWNVEGSSDEYEEIMTDIDGQRHRFTLPTGGKMQPKVWEKQKARATERLPPQFAEVITKTSSPFVQAITDLEPAEKARVMGGKGVIVGDALSGFRPHTAASTSQAAFHALTMAEVFAGARKWKEYDARVLDFAHAYQSHGVRLGDRSQYGIHPLAA